MDNLDLDGNNHIELIADKIEAVVLVRLAYVFTRIQAIQS